MLNLIQKIANVIVGSTKGNPVSSTLLVILFYFMFYILQSSIENLLFGQRIQHWLDPFSLLVFIIFAGYTVFLCDKFNRLEKRPSALKKRASKAF